MENQKTIADGSVAPIAIIEEILHEADQADASDIHVDPTEHAVLVRFRIDGLLTVRHQLPKNLHTGLISRLKILSRLRTDLHHLPQDGRLHRVYGKADDIRISIMPTHYGEAAVLRILKDRPDFVQLETLGIRPRDVETLEGAITRTRGMILATGPTGSGKTTTLYSLLRLVSSERLLLTIEDPVEYLLPGARQIQVDPDRGLTFAAGLRSMLRQDPDVIMVGEIRDTETAHIAMHAALTGHLLLSTLHTNDALSVIIRLLDMGIAPYLIAGTVETIIAQRLVRKKCSRCNKNGTQADGCSTCNYQGYSGRIAVYEIITMNDALRSAINHQPSLPRLREIAQASGMRTLIVDAQEKSQQGIVDLPELMSTL